MFYTLLGLLSGGFSYSLIRDIWFKELVPIREYNSFTSRSRWINIGTIFGLILGAYRDIYVQL
tara:strand:+ start:107 stop:295 length:189 start_codon:yes stop_codon:yes gene_type:complete